MSNITVRSNIYINRTRFRTDREFVWHIMDYRTLALYIGHSSDTELIDRNGVRYHITPLQQEIRNQNNPRCALERGSMSWGVPVGGTQLRCRCEQRDCINYKVCSRLSEFDLIVRDKDITHQHVVAHIEQTDQLLPEIEISEPVPKDKYGQLSFDDVINATTPEPFEQKVDNKLSVTESPSQLAESIETAQETEVEINITPSLQVSEPQNMMQMPIAFETVTEDINALEETALSEAITSDEETAGGYWEALASPDIIINAPIQSRIWVNAGPGTGKTYTVIQRLKYLLSQDSDDTILVLCFSRNAVQVVTERLREALDSMDDLLGDERLIVRTFDSFASYLLGDDIVDGSSYDARIQQCTKRLQEEPSLLEAVSCLVVDELQDVVGVRAELVHTLINCVKGGVLLLGDFCQAIYDWAAREQGGASSIDVLNWLKAQQDLHRYELIGNRRQSLALSRLSDHFRGVLLQGTEDEQEAVFKSCKQALISERTTIKLKTLVQNLSGSGEIILCKTNGQAAAVSQILFSGQTPIHHHVAQPTQHLALAPWIALTLSGSSGGLLSKTDFLKAATDADAEDAETKWNALKAMDGHDRSAVLHTGVVLRALSAGKALPPELLDVNKGVLVSTVHRAKGSEADNVYWLDSPLVYEDHEDEADSKAESVRAAYVAITRARKNLCIVESPQGYFMKCTPCGRWCRIGYSSAHNHYTRGIALLSDDVDPASFAATDEKSSAELRQEILQTIQSGDEVSLYLDADGYTYLISFDSYFIGRMSTGFSKAVRQSLNATNHSKRFPPSIEAYVSRVVTVVSSFDAYTDERYRDVGCWLGLELGGIGRYVWEL